MRMEQRDRYLTFAGLGCDENAAAIVKTIHRHIGGAAAASRWGDYFKMKFEEQRRLGVDDLFFVGSQMNNLFEFFAECKDDVALRLLYQVEQECC